MRATKELKSLWTLAGPIAFMQAGMACYGLVDTLCLGRLSAQALAGVGLGGSTFFTLFIFGMGCLLGVDTLSSRAFGRGHLKSCADIWVHALALAAALSLPIFFLIGLAGPLYRAVGVDAGVSATALEYLSAFRWMIFPGMVWVACRQYLQTLNVTRPLIAAIVAGNMANVVLDYALIFGRLGAPKLGALGAGWASVGAASLMTGLALAAAWVKARRGDWSFSGYKRRIFSDLLKLGLPAGLQMLAEVSVFSLTHTLMGRFGPSPGAAHQVVMNLASFTFMIPLGISFAAAVRVGQASGAGHAQRAVDSGTAAVWSSAAFMAATGVLFLVFPGFVLGLYTRDAAVVLLGAGMLKMAALFQVFDGLQVAYTGALRGLGETKLPFYANLAAHCGLGLPVGYYLAFHGGWGPQGLWIGLLTGLAAVSLALAWAWRLRSRQSLLEAVAT